MDVQKKTTEVIKTVDTWTITLTPREAATLYQLAKTVQRPGFHIDLTSEPLREIAHELEASLANAARIRHFK